jgi:hypothetical protein
VARGRASRRRGGPGQRLAAEGLEGEHAELIEELAARVAWIETAGVGLGAGERALGLGRIEQPARQLVAAPDHELARPRGAQLVAHPLPAAGARALRGEELAGGGVEPGHAHAVGPRGQGGHERGLAGVEGGGVELRARRDDAHHLAAHHPFGGLRVFHLLAHGDAETLLHEPADVGRGGMVGHAAHGNRGTVLVLRARGESDLERPGGRDRVFEEELVEIAHAEEEKCLRMLGLHPVVLQHGGRLGGGGRAHRAVGRRV